MSIFGRWRGQTLSGVTPKKFTRYFIPYTVLIAAIFAMTFFGVCIPDYGPRGPRGPAASVAGEDITRREFSRFYSEQRYRQSDADAQNLPAEIINQLIQIRAAYQMALNLGLRASHQEVLDAINAVPAFQNASGGFDAESFRNYLDSYNYTEELFYDEVRRELTIINMQNYLNLTYYQPIKTTTHLRQVLGKANVEISYIHINPQSIEATVSQEELDEFLASSEGKSAVNNHYVANKHLYPEEEIRRIKQMLVTFKGARNAIGEERSKKQAKELIQSLRTQVLSKKGSFQELAKQYSSHQSTAHQQPSQSKTDDGSQWMLKANLGPAAFAESVFATNKDHMTDIIESPFGFHLAYVEDIRTKEQTVFDEKRKAEVGRDVLLLRKQNQAAETMAKNIHRMYFSNETHTDITTQYSQAKEWQNASFSAMESTTLVNQLTKHSEQSSQAEAHRIISAILETLAGDTSLKTVVKEDKDKSTEKDNAKQEDKDNSDTDTDTDTDTKASSLAKERLLNSPFKIGNHWFIIKIVKFSAPSAEILIPPKDSSELDALRKQLYQFMVSYHGNRFAERIVQSYLEELENAQLIRRNPDYLELNRSSG